MTLTTVNLISEDQETLRLDVDRVYHSPYLVKKITGLDADDLVPKFYGFSIDGTKKFYNLNLKPRTISILIHLHPRPHLDETVKSLRDQLYKMILVGRTGLLRVQFFDGASCLGRIDGLVTKFEAPSFTTDPTITLTIQCKDPMIRGINKLTLTPTEIGTLSTIQISDSQSTAPHGFKMDIIFTGAIGEFNIQNKQVSPDWYFKLIGTSLFAVGDTLHISTEFGNKYVYRIRGGVTTYLMDKIDPSSIWPTIFSGLNSFYISQFASIDWLGIEYDTAYWGL